MKLIYTCFFIWISIVHVYAKDQEFTYDNPSFNRDDFFDYGSSDLDGQFGVGAQCGQLNLKAATKSAVNNMKDILDPRNLMQNKNAVAWALFCTYFKSECAAIQHVQKTVNFAAKFQLDRCAITDKYVSKQTASYIQTRNDCIGQQMQKNGKDFDKAIDFCDEKHGGKLYSLATSGNLVYQVDIVKDSLKWMGDFDEENYGVVKTLVGETTINTGSIKHSYGKNGRATSPLSYEESKRKHLDAILCRKFSHINKTGLNSYYKSLNLKNTIKKILLPSDIENLFHLDKQIRPEYCQIYATFAAEEITRVDVKNTLKQLTVASENPNNTEITKKFINLKINKLKIYLDNNGISGSTNFYDFRKNLQAKAIKSKNTRYKTFKRDSQNSNKSKNTINELLDKCNYSAECD